MIFCYYRVISSARDYDVLQEMVSSIEQWSADNYFYLHPMKCKYMIVSRKRVPTLPEKPWSCLGMNWSESVATSIYLGVLVTCLGLLMLATSALRHAVYWVSSTEGIVWADLAEYTETVVSVPSQTPHGVCMSSVGPSHGESQESD